MQYNLYTVSVTNGSNIVNGALGTKFLSKVKAGNSFKVKGDAVVYQISSVVSDTQLTLSTNYQGATAANLQYQVTTDYTPNFGFAEINIGDQDWPTHLTVETIRKIDSVLAYTAGDGLKFQGDWNAATNVPTIPAASSSNLGHLYKVTVSGSTSVSGITHWVVGDTVISNGTAWFRIALPEYSAEEYAVAAEASASSASTSASTATTKANDASGYAQSATVSMNNAASSASTASTKAGEASTSATNAAASAGTATTKAGEASTSATNANTAKLAAEAARDQALTAFDNFDDKYLGQKSANPTLDNDGNPLVSGALYFNTNDIGAGGGMKVYDGATWVAAYAAIDSTLVALSTVSTSADKLIYATGVDTFNTTTLTSAARSLLDDTTTTSMLTTLGAAPAAQGVTNGDSHGHVGGDGAAISLTAAVSGTLPVLNGGTGATASTGTGSVVLATSPTLVTPNIGVATGTSFNSLTGLASVAPVAPEATALVGTSTLAARQDHVHPIDTSRQATLVNESNIKSVNGQSLVGSGGITVTGGVSASGINSNTTAVKDTRYVCDTSAAGFTLTLPAAPAVGDYIEVVDSDGTWATNNLTVARNSLKINGLSEDLVLNVSNAFVTFTYGDVARGWQVDIGGSALVSTPADNSVTYQKLFFDGGRTPHAFFKADFASVAFAKTGAGTISIKAGTFCLVGTSNTMVSWPTQTAITMPSHTIGTDYYIYACADGSIRADANATNPTGYDTTNSRKIGGYHYGRVRNTLTVTDVAIEIVPRSLWDLTYRPKCNPAGMVDVYGNGSLWADIYLAVVDSAITLTDGVVIAGTCKSIYNGTPLSGTEGLHGYNFIELAKNSGKRLLTHSEWLAVAHGSPQGNDGDNLNAWSATTNSARTGTGQVARAVSFCGACDCVGNLWEWLDELSNDYSTAIAANWYNSMTGQNVGQQYLYNSTGLRMYLAGGSWSYGVFAGSRALDVTNSPWNLYTSIGSRFACDGL